MLYFRGCTAREKQLNIAKACEKLLKLANINYHTLNNEPCCGSILLRTGFYEDALKQIEKNTQILKNESIITSCAGCYKTLTENYDNLDVMHISQLLNELIEENKLNFTKHDLNVTFHDSCHLARHMKVYDEPRNVIKSKANLLEMENNRENSLCCGSGGGVKSAYPEISQKISQDRLNQAKDTGCEILITTCPFCKINLENEDIEVLDICEFLVGDFDERK